MSTILTILKIREMKKIALVILILISTTSSLNATIIRIGIADDMGFGLAAQFNGIINAQVGNAGICADYIVRANKLKADGIGDSLSWYVGAGMGYRWSDGYKGGLNSDIDLRLPVGLNLQFLKDWDAYAQLIPSLRINNGIGFVINAAIGVRYIFITD